MLVVFHWQNLRNIPIFFNITIIIILYIPNFYKKLDNILTVTPANNINTHNRTTNLVSLISYSVFSLYLPSGYLSRYAEADSFSKHSLSSLSSFNFENSEYFPFGYLSKYSFGENLLKI